VTTLTIAGLAREGGVGVETIRYYQRRGLLPEPPRTGGSSLAGGIRRYDDEAVRRLKFVRSAQAAGFTLEEVGELLELDATDDRPRARAMARGRIAALEQKIRELEAAKVWLTRLADECGASDVGRCPILQAFEAS
jgi:MerR family mercuric resistance operon transcriptional regulator